MSPNAGQFFPALAHVSSLQSQSTPDLEKKNLIFCSSKRTSLICTYKANTAPPKEAPFVASTAVEPRASRCCKPMQQCES